MNPIKSIITLSYYIFENIYYVLIYIKIELYNNITIYILLKLNAYNIIKFRVIY